MRAPANREGGSRFLYEPFGRGGGEENHRYSELLRELGTPEQVREKVKILEQLIEEKRRRDWLFRSVRTVAGWATVVASGWLAFRGLLVEFLADMKR